MRLEAAVSIDTYLHMGPKDRQLYRLNPDTGHAVLRVRGVDQDHEDDLQALLLAEARLAKCSAMMQDVLDAGRTRGVRFMLQRAYVATSAAREAVTEVIGDA